MASTESSSTTTTSSSSSNYCQDVIPPSTLEKLQAGAFRQLCRHLQERADPVQNMDLMTLSGFCRNCLAKWMVVEARALVDDNNNNNNDNNNDNNLALDDVTVQALNALGYEEAAQHVYGMTYGDWKRRHQKKATDEQLQNYKASSALHAKHDKELLATRGTAPVVVEAEETTSTTTTTTATVTTSTTTTTSPASLLSNVCCQTVDGNDTATANATQQSTPTTTPVTTTPTTTTTTLPAKNNTRTLPPYQPAPLPTYSTPHELRVGILTVSDRASRGDYVTGDLSGPAVEQALQQQQQQQVLANPSQSSSSANLQLTIVARAIVPDDASAIGRQLQEWHIGNNDSGGGVDLIFTTGGTGLGPRDVTPEATRQVLSTECQGLMTFCLAECSKLQPLASLSRGTAGLMTSGPPTKDGPESTTTKTTTMVANLPGNPQAVHEMMPLLLPLMLHAQLHF